MEQLADLVTKFENVMIAGGSLFALWGVYNLLEEKTKGRPGHGTEWWQVLAASLSPAAASPISSPSCSTAS